MGSNTIPYALDTKTKQIISVFQAKKDAPKGSYTCQGNDCKLPIQVCTSKLGRNFFKHWRSSKRHQCRSTKSQDKHTRAKHTIRDAFLNAIDHRAPMPRLIFETPHKVHEVLPFFFKATIELEFHIKIQVDDFTTKDIYIDVALLDENRNPLLLIEVLNTHPVDHEKTSYLEKYWWIEVHAKDVIKDPLKLIVKKRANFHAEYDLGMQKMLF